MSTRSRAAPWFVDRPDGYREEMREWLKRDHVEFSREWSWDGITWFDARGRCVHVGSEDEYGYPFLRTLEREFSSMAAAYRNWRAPRG